MSWIFFLLLASHERIRFTVCLKVKRVFFGANRLNTWAWVSCLTLKGENCSVWLEQPTRQTAHWWKRRDNLCINRFCVAYKPVIDTYIDILIAYGRLRASRTDKTRFGKETVVMSRWMSHNFMIGNDFQGQPARPGMTSSVWASEVLQ